MYVYINIHVSVRGPRPSESLGVSWSLLGSLGFSWGRNLENLAPGDVFGLLGALKWLENLENLAPADAFGLLKTLKWFENLENLTPVDVFGLLGAFK